MAKSTDHNLKNPLSVGPIDMQRLVESARFPFIYECTQKEYDVMTGTRDPYTIFVITDSTDRRMYMGDLLITKPNRKNEYLLRSADNNEYEIIMNQIMGWEDHLITIARYTDPMQAVKDMRRYNRQGGHYAIQNSTYELLLNYIDGDITLHTLLMMNLANFGYREDPELQSLQQFCMSYGTSDGNGEDIPLILIQHIDSFSPAKALFQMYSRMYDMIVKYDFFKDIKKKRKRGDAEDPDLSDVIHDLLCVVNRETYLLGA